MVVVSKVCCLAEGGEQTVPVSFTNMNVLKSRNGEKKGERKRKEEGETSERKKKA